MANHPNNVKFNLEDAERHLNFAIQFTPQYGDSFLELLRLYLMRGDSEDKIKQLKQQCLHAEPNYGVLWFYYKETHVDNAKEVWERAIVEIKSGLARSASGAQKLDENWIGSSKLIRHLRSGLSDCDIETKVKIIYGFEMVLPQVAYL